MAFYNNIIQSFSSFVGTDARQIGKDCIAVGFRLPALVAGCGRHRKQGFLKEAESKLEVTLRQHQPLFFRVIEQLGTHFAQRNTVFFVKQGNDSRVLYDILAESGIKHS